MISMLVFEKIHRKLKRMLQKILKSRLRFGLSSELTCVSTEDCAGGSDDFSASRKMLIVEYWQLSTAI